MDKKWVWFLQVKPLVRLCIIVKIYQNETNKLEVKFWIFKYSQSRNSINLSLSNLIFDIICSIASFSNRSTLLQKIKSNNFFKNSIKMLIWRCYVLKSNFKWIIFSKLNFILDFWTFFFLEEASERRFENIFSNWINQTSNWETSSLTAKIQFSKGKKVLHI